MPCTPDMRGAVQLAAGAVAGVSRIAEGANKGAVFDLNSARTPTGFGLRRKPLLSNVHFQIQRDPLPPETSRHPACKNRFHQRFPIDTIFKSC